MDNVNENGEHNELLQAQANVWNHTFTFMNSMSLKCAVDLGIPDIIQNHGKPMTVIELLIALPKLKPAKACNINRLMRVLVHSGFFARQKLGEDEQEYGYVLTSSSHLLLKNHPLSLTPFLKLILEPFVTKPSHFLATWFQNDDGTPFESAHGKTFNEGMASDARLVARVLLDKCKETFKRCKEAISRRDKAKGKVIIIDMVLMKGDEAKDETSNSIETQLFMDMHMMAMVCGKERHEEDWAKLFFDAGFSDYKISPILGLRSLIEVF